MKRPPFHESREYFALLTALWAGTAGVFIKWGIPVAVAELAFYAQLLGGAA